MVIKGDGSLAEGEAAITPGFHLPAKYIIHAVSPQYIAGESREEEKQQSNVLFITEGQKMS